MLEKLKKLKFRIKEDWNTQFTNSLFFMCFAIIASSIEHELDKSLVYFAIAMIFMGLGELLNSIKELLNQNKKDNL